MMMTKSNNNFSSIKDLIKGQTRMKGGGDIQPSSPTSVMEFPQQQQRRPTTATISRPRNKNSKKIIPISCMWIIMIFSLSTNLYAIISLHHYIIMGEDSSIINDGTNNSFGPPPQQLRDTHSYMRKYASTTTTTADGSGLPLPTNWEHFDYKTSRKYFQCSNYGHDPTKPLPTIEFWNRLREDYIKHVDPSYTFDELVPPTEGYNFDTLGNPPPYYAGHGHRGRGVFASRNIKRGELVHDGTKSDIVFPDSMSWRRLLFNLPRRVACDVIDWSWVQQLEVGGDYKLLSAINISVLFNDAKHGYKMNVNPMSGTSSKFYALRDIRMGEELLTNYDMYDTDWVEVGL